VGSDEYNQKLSQQRADGVHDYLVSQGVPATDVTSIGYGTSNPVADNSTAAGRSQNRRVQLVVSGNAIGIQETQPSAEGQPAAPPQSTPAPAPQGPPPPPQGVSHPPE
jgi:hypothetical protein